MKKKIIKFIVVAILIFGVYYGSRVTPVEEKRVGATLENVREWEAVSFDLEGSIEDSRQGFYDLEVRNGYIEKDESRAKGDFSLNTRLEGENQRVEGVFLYDNADLYLNFDEEGLPIVLEGFFRENFNQDIEVVRNNWVKFDFEYNHPSFSLIEESVEEIDDEEEIEEKEMYHYGFDLEVAEIVEGPVRMEMFTDYEHLNLYRLLSDTEIKLARDFEAIDPFGSFLAGNSLTLKLEASFSDFNEIKEMEIPEEYLDL